MHTRVDSSDSPAGATAAMSPEAVYQERARRFEAERAAIDGRARQVSHARLGSFLLFLALGVGSELHFGMNALLAAGSGAMLLIFASLVRWHQVLRARSRRRDLLRELNVQGLDRLARAWDRLPSRAAGMELGDHPYAGDLDLFGRPSLAQLLGPTHTPAGTATLTAWLIQPAPVDTVRERQRAVQEMAPENDLRDTFAAHGRETHTVRAEDIDRFLSWAESSPWLAGRPGLLWTARLLPALTVALMVADALGSPTGSAWLIPLALAIGVTLSGPGRAVRAIFRQAFGREGMFHAYPELLATVAHSPCRAPLLARLQAELTTDALTADRQMRRLYQLMHLADLRYSGMLYLLVQPFTLWDIHVLHGMERWQRRSGARVRRWLEVLGEIEALCATATLAHDHPDWTFADIDPAADAWEGEAVGHPMLGEAVRIPNDVRVGPPGTFLLVTGSNMSGKSTLLRAIGLNTALAGMGAPVCAARLRLPPVALYTSIHVEDSLVEGISYFMAQLQRMRLIVEAADRSHESGAPRLLYLLDEILQGTNTAERRIAARRVIRHLVQSGAIGVVTTHDLELAEEPELAGLLLARHFAEQVHGAGPGPIMTFDYLLRPGVATSTNALRLMEIVGLA